MEQLLVEAYFESIFSHICISMILHLLIQLFIFKIINFKRGKMLYNFVKIKIKN